MKTLQGSEKSSVSDQALGDYAAAVEALYSNAYQASKEGGAVAVKWNNIARESQAVGQMKVDIKQAMLKEGVPPTEVEDTIAKAASAGISVFLGRHLKSDNKCFDKAVAFINQSIERVHNTPGR